VKGNGRRGIGRGPKRGDQIEREGNGTRPQKKRKKKNC